jgi:hypothetical protein
MLYMFRVLITHLQEQLLRTEAVGITTCKILHDARNHELETSYKTALMLHYMCIVCLAIVTRDRFFRCKLEPALLSVA